MALCLQAFTGATKRSCDYAAFPQKRACLSKLNLNASLKLNPACYSLSSDECELDDQLYRADQARAKRRALSRVSFSLNNSVSAAVCKYSDDFDLPCVQDTESADCKLIGLPSLQGHAALRNSRNFLHISDLGSNPGRERMPDDDKVSRARCFDYLVGAIDEAWARYCDAASCVEEESLGLHSPESVATDEEDCFGNSTDLTDYDSDVDGKGMPAVRLRARLLRDASSCHLQELKDRLTKAKYFLQDLVDSSDYSDAFAFWKRWDMVKYATIELVEDDDDDEVIEAAIDELEHGRLLVN